MLLLLVPHTLCILHHLLLDVAEQAVLRNTTVENAQSESDKVHIVQYAYCLLARHDESSDAIFHHAFDMAWVRYCVSELRIFFYASGEKKSGIKPLLSNLLCQMTYKNLGFVIYIWRYRVSVLLVDVWLD